MFGFPTACVCLARTIFRTRRGDKLARILVIEDDHGCRELYRSILESDGHTVTEAPDGSDGLELAQSDNMDLVLTDLIMPNTDGIEVIVKLTDSHPALPIIAISGGGSASSDTYLRAAIGLGAKMVLKKPVQPNDLTTAITSCLSSAAE
jgi:CheY-like chemotaxis protein